MTPGIAGKTPPSAEDAPRERRRRQQWQQSERHPPGSPWIAATASRSPSMTTASRSGAKLIRGNFIAVA